MYTAHIGLYSYSTIKKSIQGLFIAEITDMQRWATTLKKSQNLLQAAASFISELRKLKGIKSRDRDLMQCVQKFHTKFKRFGQNCHKALMFEFLHQ